MRSSRGRPRRRFARLLILALAILFAALIIAVIEWPFTRKKVIADLADAMQGKVEIGRFHRTYFPHIGCVAEDVTFTGYGNLANSTPMTVRKLTIQDSIRGLFTHHVPVMRAEGVHLVAARADSFAGWGTTNGKEKSPAVVDQLIITESVLEFSSKGAPGLKFEIAELSLIDRGPRAPMQFAVVLRNPKPPGEVRASGSLGPWSSNNSGQTPVSGKYSFQHADLSVFHGIAGTLSSEGSFAGNLHELEISGKTDMPDFELTDTGHKVALSTQFRARVNTRHGDVVLEQVAGRLGRSGVESAGSIAGQPNQPGKTTDLNMAVPNGRIQDFLFLFLKEKVPPMNGVFSFRGRAVLPSGKEPFTRRVQLEGDFGVDNASLANPVTQGKLEELSERAEGQKGEAPERIVSDLKGHLVLRQGIASFSGLTFRVPGAKAKLHGTYSLLDYRINLQGRLFTEATLSEATTGVKSFLLKVISPVLKKNHHGGGVVALGVTGVYPHPVYKTTPVTKAD